MKVTHIEILVNDQMFIDYTSWSKCRTKSIYKYTSGNHRQHELSVMYLGSLSKTHYARDRYQKFTDFVYLAVFQ